jgi:polar amino acid transport system permease protein
MRYVILPQAIRIVIPVLLSNSISLFKESSLVSTVGMSDLMYIGRILSANTYRPIEILTTVAVIYFIVAFPATLVTRKLEVALAKKLER